MKIAAGLTITEWANTRIGESSHNKHSGPVWALWINSLDSPFPASYRTWVQQPNNAEKSGPGYGESASLCVLLETDIILSLYPGEQALGLNNLPNNKIANTRRPIQFRAVHVQEITRVRGIIPKVLCSSEDVTRVTRGEPKRLSRNHMRRNGGNVLVYVFVSKQRCSLCSQPSFCSAGLSFLLCLFGCSLFCRLFGLGSFSKL